VGSTEREALDALVDRTQQRVTGTVRLKLYKGNAIIAGRSTPVLAVRRGARLVRRRRHYDHADAAGFIRLFSLPTRAEAQQTRRADSPARRRHATNARPSRRRAQPAAAEVEV
jgi:argininosuccinate synthase